MKIWKWPLKHQGHSLYSIQYYIRWLSWTWVAGVDTPAVCHKPPHPCGKAVGGQFLDVGLLTSKVREKGVVIPPANHGDCVLACNFILRSRLSMPDTVGMIVPYYILLFPDIGKKSETNQLEFNQLVTKRERSNTTKSMMSIVQKEKTDWKKQSGKKN